MKRLGPLIHWALFLASVAGVIYPAFLESPPGAPPPPGFTRSVVLLFTDPKLEQAYFLRLLCLVVAGASAYILIVTIFFRNAPITAVRTEIKFSFNEDLSRATVSRDQVLRANQPGVSAYFSRIKPTSPNGTVPGHEITMQAYCRGCDLVSTFDIDGSDKAGYEVIHAFGVELPYRWYMPLIPAWALRKKPAEMGLFFRNHLVERRQSASYVNDFNAQKPRMNFVAASYPQHNISVAMGFVGPVPSDFRARRIKTNGVIDVHVDRGADSIMVHVDKLRNETLRLSWTNPHATNRAPSDPSRKA